jgi:trans-2,3-dihydro-3-hydroxyanthranilate isomerase
VRRRLWRPVHGVTDVVMVRSCTRGGHGGSPTAVVIEHGPLGDTTRAAMARDMPASHTAFLCPRAPGDAELTGVRFFTRQGELSGCGHGTIAVMAVLVHMGVVERGRAQLAIAGRVVPATSTAVGDEVEVWITHGDVPIGPAPRDMLTDLLAPLGLNGHAQMAGAAGGPDGHRSVTRVDAVVARPGAARLLVRVADRATLSSIRPNHVTLAAACRRHGLLGCFVHATDEHSPGRHTGAGRMFAPVIGVDEDIANTNSTAGLAAALTVENHATCRLTTDQGDWLGTPSTVFARAEPVATGAHVFTGGRAHVTGAFQQ